MSPPRKKKKGRIRQTVAKVLKKLKKRKKK